MGFTPDSVNPKAYLASGQSLIIDQKRHPGLLSSKNSDDMRREMREALGLGPRTCDCGTTFTPPPYLHCKDMVKCTECAEKAFLEWALTAEGVKAIEDFNQSLKR